MNTRSPDPSRPDLRTLTSYELSIRNALAIEARLHEVLAQYEERFPELVEQLRRQLAFCDSDRTLDALIALRNALTEA